MAEQKKDKKMTLYYGSGSPPCMKVIFVLEEKGLVDDCNINLLMFDKKEHKSEKVMKLNPRGQVPTFIDGEVVVNESIAVCLYLEYAYPGSGTSLLPKDSAKRALVYQRMFELSNVQTAMQAFYGLSEDEKTEAKMKDMCEKLTEELNRWETYLSGGKFLCGDEFSMADVFLYIATAMLLRQGGKLDKFPKLKAFNECVLAERKGAKTSEPPHWKTVKSPNYMEGFGA